MNSQGSLAEANTGHLGARPQPQGFCRQSAAWGELTAPNHKVPKEMICPLRRPYAQQRQAPEPQLPEQHGGDCKLHAVRTLTDRAPIRTEGNIYTMAERTVEIIKQNYNFF